MTKLATYRIARAALEGADIEVVVHSVRRVGDAGHATITLVAKRDGKQTWKASRLAVSLDTRGNGVTPHMGYRTERTRSTINVLRMVMGPHKFTSLSYLVDSFAHYWINDNAKHLYR